MFSSCRTQFRSLSDAMNEYRTQRQNNGALRVDAPQSGMCFLAAGAREQVLRSHFRVAYAANDTRERFHAPSWRIVTCGCQQQCRQQAANASTFLRTFLRHARTREFRDASRHEERKKKGPTTSRFQNTLQTNVQ